MSKPKARYRWWLIFAGIVLVLLALPLLRFRMRVLLSKMGVVILLLGAALVVLGRLGKKKQESES